MEDRYTEALNTAKMWYRNTVMPDNVKEIFRRIFPELKESEDEKVRQELLAVVNDLVLPDEQQSRFVAWLEKQGEQKPKPVDGVGSKFKPGDWVMYKNGACFSDNSISARVRSIEGHKVWLEHGTWVDESELKKITD